MMQKITRALLTVFGIALLYSCNPYKHTTLTNDELYNQRRLAGSYKKYVILMHEPSTDSIYKLDNVVFTQDTIYGDLNPIQSIDTAQLSRSNKNEVRKRVYLELNEDVDLSNVDPGSRIILPKKRVNKVRMYAKKKKGVLGIVGTALLIILAAILALILVIVVAVLSSDTGGSTSGGSNTGGGGGGGGGNSGSSSCYVATMVYGSSESEEVMVLRRFRDQVLAQSSIGRGFILWYYRNSPSFVEKWESNSVVTRSIKAMLNPFVRLISGLMK